jgi:hypothetical protein
MSCQGGEKRSLLVFVKGFEENRRRAREAMNPSRDKREQNTCRINVS